MWPEHCALFRPTYPEETTLTISFLVRLRFAAEDRAAIADCLRQLAVASREEEGCITYLPSQVEDDPDCVLIFEQYRDGKALQAHRNSEHFKKLAVGGLYQKMRERTVENLQTLA